MRLLRSHFFVGILAVVLSIFLAAPVARAQAAPPAKSPAPTANPTEPQKMLLWEHGAPGALGSDETDIPTLTYYAPAYGSPSGTAVIVAPGGGYTHLAANHEGRQVANWLNSLGVAAFVLTYRLGPRYHHPIELDDAQRAVRLVRSRAKEFNIFPDRIGMMGFSAGGHLTSTVITHFDDGNSSAPDPMDRFSSRPDFAILCYPVISLMAPYVHAGSLKFLLGDNPDPRLLEDLSNDLHVTPQTPPTFLFATSEDKAVPVENSVAFYLALKKAGVPAELHVFEKGPHGVGLDLGDPVLGEWPKLLANWLRSRGLLSRP